ncbi:MAG: aminoacyl-histidine dipeptidase [Bacteroidales bacterium]
MGILSQLKPVTIWNYFEEICGIPRASKKEEKIREFLIAFGKKNTLETRVDKGGNVLIIKPPYPGYEKKETVVLQCHIDMVCEKNSSSTHNFDTDPIKPVIRDGWVRAEGTTLGADNGIGVAAMIAILADPGLEHGPVECLFTVDEETGLTGAQMLEAGFITGKYLLNLDSEDEGELCIGCAGGIDTVATLTPEYEVPARGFSPYTLSVTGLSGGHSGEDINNGLGNSIKLITRILREGSRRYGIRIAQLRGGNLRNAIAREAFAEILIPVNQLAAFKEMADRLYATFRKEFNKREENMKIELVPGNELKQVFVQSFQDRLLDALYACPHGVKSMSREIPGLVETSTNLASVKIADNGKYVISTSQRSAKNDAKHDIAVQVECVFSLAGAEVEHSTGYPGWEPNPSSEIIRTARTTYVRLFGKEPELKAIHAGLECGLFLEKYPHLDMVSFGPTIKSPHSPDERVEIKTVEIFWDYLLAVLKDIPQK